MAVTMNTTVAGTDSNSYVGLTEADAYLSERDDNSQWDDLTDDQKREKLIQATRVIDGYPFEGVKYDTSTTVSGDYSGQALAFPRSGDADSTGTVFVPDEVKWATCEVAWLLLTNRAAFGVSTVSNLKVGSLAVALSGADEAAGVLDKVVGMFLSTWMVRSLELD